MWFFFFLLLAIAIGFGWLGQKTTRIGYQSGWPLYVISFFAAGGALAFFMWLVG